MAYPHTAAHLRIFPPHYATSRIIPGFTSSYTNLTSTFLFTPNLPIHPSHPSSSSIFPTSIFPHLFYYNPFIPSTSLHILPCPSHHTHHHTHLSTLITPHPSHPSHPTSPTATPIPPQPFHHKHSTTPIPSQPSHHPSPPPTSLPSSTICSLMFTH